MKKFNFNLRAFALAVATLFAAAGCSSDDTAEDEKVEGGGKPDGPAPTTYTIEIAASDIKSTSATFTVTPSSAELTYVVDLVAKSDYAEYASPEAFAAADVEALKAEALAAESALDAYLVAQGILNNGTKSKQFDGLTAKTEYVAYAYGLSMEGEITTDVAVAEFTTSEDDPEPAKGPDAEVVIIAGEFDEAGENIIDTATSVTVGVTLANETDVVTAVYEFFESTELIEQTLNVYDMTYEELLEVAIQGNWKEVYTYSESDIAFLNENRIIVGSYPNLDPETSYTAIIKVMGSDDASTVVYASASTTSAGEATDAYNAWLGTWTVTSTSATHSQEAKTFDITISQRYANHSYLIGGLTSSVFRDEADMDDIFPAAMYDAATGKFTIANQMFFGGEDEGRYNEFWYNMRYLDVADNMTYVDNTDGLIGLIGALNAGSTDEGQITGTTLEYSSGKTAGTVLWMDYFSWYYDDSGNVSDIYGFKPADMFSYGEDGLIDYPIGPFTLVRKAEPQLSSEPASEMPETTKLRVKSLGSHALTHQQMKLGPVFKTTEEVQKPSKIFDYRLSDKKKLAARLLK